MSEAKRQRGGVEEIEGWFWVPGEERRFFGRLEIEATADIRVHLVDTGLIEFGPETVAPRPTPVLHGEGLGGGPHYTVLGFTAGEWRSYGRGAEGSEGDVVDGFAETLLAGAHLDQLDSLLPEVLTASIFGLRELLGGTRVDPGLLRPEREDFKSEVIKVEIDEDVSLLASVMRQPHWENESEGWRTVAHAQFDVGRALPYTTLQESYLQPLRDLVSFATRRRSWISSQSAHFASEPKVVRVIEPGETAWAGELRDVYALVLNLGRVGNPQAVLAGWFDLHRRVGPVWNLFFAALNRNGAPLEETLLNLVSFGEGYHRALHDHRPLSSEEEREAKRAVKAALPDPRIRGVYNAALHYANSSSLLERLEEMVARSEYVAGDWLDDERFCRKVRDTRDWLTHWGESRDDVVHDSRGRVLLIRRLIVVIYANLLLDIGLDAEEALAAISTGWRVGGLP